MHKQILVSMSKAGVELVTGVPDSLLRSVIEEFDQAGFKHVRTSSEGAAVAVASGWSISEHSLPLVYMQNSGLGNAVSPLMSLAHSRVYGLQMILLIGWRGRPGHQDEPQHAPQGEVTEALLDLLEIPYLVIEPGSTQEETDAAFATAARHGGCFAILVGPNTLTPAKDLLTPNEVSSATHPARADYIGVMIEANNLRNIYVSTTGYTSREAYVLFKEATILNQLVMNVGAMGHAMALALGLALAKPENQIFCLDGDGSLAMHMGSLSTIALQAPKNFVHVVFNNKSHESVGSEPTVLGDSSLAQLSLVLGYKTATFADSSSGLQKLLNDLKGIPGPHLIELATRTGVPENLPRPSETLRELLRGLRAAIKSNVRG